MSRHNRVNFKPLAEKLIIFCWIRDAATTHFALLISQTGWFEIMTLLRLLNFVQLLIFASHRSPYVRLLSKKTVLFLLVHYIIL